MFQAVRGKGLRRSWGREGGVHVAECRGAAQGQVGDDVGPKMGKVGGARPGRALTAMAGDGMR